MKVLQNANEELQSITGGFELKLHGLSDQLKLKEHQIEHIYVDESKDKSRLLEWQKKLDEEHGCKKHWIQQISARSPSFKKKTLYMLT